VSNPNLEQLRDAWSWIARIEDQKTRDFSRAYMYHLQLTGSAEPDYREYGLDQALAFFCTIILKELGGFQEKTKSPVFPWWAWLVTAILLGTALGLLITA
jgi:hypothetical protein